MINEYRDGKEDTWPYYRNLHFVRHEHKAKNIPSSRRLFPISQIALSLHLKSVAHSINFRVIFKQNFKGLNYSGLINKTVITLLKDLCHG